MNFSYKLSAVKGIQANKKYYIAMVPLRYLSRLFSNDEEFIPPEYRAQRRLNSARIPIIKNYMLQNRDTYVFSALAASIDGEHTFTPLHGFDGIGTLEISMDARFLIVDGQHRKASIIEAIEEDETLLNETISIVFFEDKGLRNCQQMFTDLNKHAVKTSNSIAELYDSRDALAVITRSIISEIDFLNKYTDKERDILGKYSSNFFTLNTFYKANKKIIKKSTISNETEDFLKAYWSEVSKHIVQWKELENREISKIDLREQFIITQAVIIQALGILGNYFFEHYSQNMDALNKLRTIDWSRNAACWKFRVIRGNGKIINSEGAAVLSCNIIKNLLGLPLTAEEQSKEDKFIRECE